MLMEKTYNGKWGHIQIHIHTHLYIYTCLYIHTGTYRHIYIKLEKENIRIFKVDDYSGTVAYNFFFEFFSILLIFYYEDDHFHNQKGKQAFFKCMRSDQGRLQDGRVIFSTKLIKINSNCIYLSLTACPFNILTWKGGISSILCKIKHSPSRLGGLLRDTQQVCDRAGTDHPMLILLLFLLWHHSLSLYLLK